MEVTAPFPLASACVHASLASHEAEPPACDLERNRGRPRGCLMVQLNLLLILLTPIAHSKPRRAMIPAGATAGTSAGGVGGGFATTIKPGDPLSSPSVAAL